MRMPKTPLTKITLRRRRRQVRPAG
jgi:hypothetical protein